MPPPADTRVAATTEGDLAREVERRGLEWLRIEGTSVELPTEGMAREAALLVRDDGRPLAEVAAECGVQARSLRVYVGEVDADLAPALLGANVGDLIGPEVQDDSFRAPPRRGQGASGRGRSGGAREGGGTPGRALDRAGNRHECALA